MVITLAFIETDATITRIIGRTYLLIMTHTIFEVYNIVIKDKIKWKDKRQTGQIFVIEKLHYQINGVKISVKDERNRSAFIFP